jgi:hypothetical protein
MNSVNTLATLLCVAATQSGGTAASQEPQFAAPIRLMAGDEPLGESRLYPSPRLYDIDQDGVDELVIGDLFGHVHVAEKIDGQGPAAWGKLEPFMSGKRALKFHNW